MASSPPGYQSHFARMSHVLELRRAGKNYQQIADICGFSKPERAQAYISKAIKRVLRETAEEIRSVELSRLELLIKTIWNKAIEEAEMPDPDFRRFDRLKGLIEAKLKWCGAQPITDEDPLKGRISITINKFTNGTLPPAIISLPAPDDKQREMEEELAMLVPDNDKPEPFR